MLDLGLILDTVVEAIAKSPSGDPTAYQIRGAVIALRSEEAGKILVEPV
ncbi:MAG: Ferrous iron transport protein A [Firmicutes bacterium]|nr:Ferrous iron transport protein A [Bacillota bacterium]